MYHHGNLRDALLDAGEQVGRTGGPAALHLRHLTLQAGVSPTAAYRHFSDWSALVLAIADRVQTRMMRHIQDTLPPHGNRRNALYTNYIHYSFTEPGWYHVATMNRQGLASAGAQLPQDAQSPQQHLYTKLWATHLAEGDANSDERITWHGWATAHGFATLTADGALDHLPHPQRERQITLAVNNAIHIDQRLNAYPEQSATTEMP